MRMILPLGFTLFLIATGVPAAQDTGGLKSSLKVGEVLPGPFDVYNINGKTAKGRQHCLVCDYGLNPVVMVFAREPAAGKDGALVSLLAKLDDAVSRYRGDHLLGSCAIFLSPDANSSASNPGEQDAKKIVDEAIAREALIKRLEERAEKLKNVVVGFFPADGPKGYQINPKAEVTVLFYSNHKVLANFAYAEGQMGAEDVSKIIKSVDDAFAAKKTARDR